MDRSFLRILVFFVLARSSSSPSGIASLSDIGLNQVSKLPDIIQDLRNEYVITEYISEKCMDLNQTLQDC